MIISFIGSYCLNRLTLLCFLSHMKTGSVLVWTGQQTPLRIRSHWWEGYGLASSLLRRSSWQPFIAPLTFNAMTKKTLSEFSAPSTSQVPVGHAVNTGDVNFEIKTGLINMVQASHFVGKPTRTLVHISNNSWSSAAPSQSEGSVKMLSASGCSRSLYSGERSSGSMRTRRP